MNRRSHRQREAMTLIELIVVVVIVALAGSGLSMSLGALTTEASSTACGLPVTGELRIKTPEARSRPLSRFAGNDAIHLRPARRKSSVSFWALAAPPRQSESLTCARTATG